MAESVRERRKLTTHSVIVAVVVVILAGGGGAFTAWVLKKPSSLSPETISGLEASPDHLNFGEVWEDKKFIWVVPIANHQNHPVEIKRFTGTCPCSRIEPNSLVIPAGQTREIQIILDLSARTSEESQLSIRDFDVSISPDLPVDARSPGRIWWTIKGRVRSAILCQPSFIDFGRRSELDQPIPSQKVTIRTATEVRGLTAVCKCSGFEVNVQRHSSKEPDLFDLTVVSRGVLPQGELNCSIAIVPELIDGRHLPTNYVKVKGMIVSDIEAFPPSLLFGPKPVGTSRTEAVTLRSSMGRPFTVTEVRCEGEGLSVQRMHASASHCSSFGVKHKVSVKGQQAGAVIFSISRPGKKEEQIRVPVEYFGIEDNPI